MRSLAAYGEVFVRNVMSSGVIPQISLILGPCAGGAVYSPALTDFVLMAGDSTMFLTGPDVIQAVTGEQVSAQTLGGADVHTGRSGVAHLSADTEAAGLELVKVLLSYLPQNNSEDPPQVMPEEMCIRDSTKAWARGARDQRRFRCPIPAPVVRAVPVTGPQAQTEKSKSDGIDPRVCGG